MSAPKRLPWAKRGKGEVLSTDPFVSCERSRCRALLSSGTSVSPSPQPPLSEVRLKGFRAFAIEQWLFERSCPNVAVTLSQSQADEIVVAQVPLSSVAPERSADSAALFHPPSSDFTVQMTRHGRIVLLDSSRIEALQLIPITTGDADAEMVSIARHVTLKRLGCGAGAPECQRDIFLKLYGEDIDSTLRAAVVGSGQIDKAAEVTTSKLQLLLLIINALRFGSFTSGKYDSTTMAAVTRCREKLAIPADSAASSGFVSSQLMRVLKGHVESLKATCAKLSIASKLLVAVDAFATYEVTAEDAREWSSVLERIGVSHEQIAVKAAQGDGSGTTTPPDLTGHVRPRRRSMLAAVATIDLSASSGRAEEFSSHEHGHGEKKHKRAGSDGAMAAAMAREANAVNDDDAVSLDTSSVDPGRHHRKHRHHSKHRHGKGHGDEGKQPPSGEAKIDAPGVIAISVPRPRSASTSASTVSRHRSNSLGDYDGVAAADCAEPYLRSLARERAKRARIEKELEELRGKMSKLSNDWGETHSKFVQLQQQYWVLTYEAEERTRQLEELRQSSEMSHNRLMRELAKANELLSASKYTIQTNTQKVSRLESGVRELGRSNRGIVFHVVMPTLLKWALALASFVLLGVAAVVRLTKRVIVRKQDGPTARSVRRAEGLVSTAKSWTDSKRVDVAKSLSPPPRQQQQQQQ